MSFVNTRVLRVSVAHPYPERNMEAKAEAELEAEVIQFLASLKSSAESRREKKEHG